METWNAADAKRQFAKVLQGSRTTPQILLLRGKPFSVVISYDSFAKNREAYGEKSLSQWLLDLSALHESDVDMETTQRHNRADPFGEDWK